MSGISPSVLAGISSLVAPETINYVCLVEYEHVPWYLAMGRTSFYFISKPLTEFLDPPVPYSRIQECRLAAKQTTLLQLQLTPSESSGDRYRGSSKDPRVILEIAIEKTYGTGG